MFDADNTLLDFSGASKLSLWQTFEDYGHACTPEIYSYYKTVNGRVWTDFEEGRITAKVLRPKRFEDLFEVIGFAPTTPENFSKRYLENLIVKSEMYADVPELLAKIKPDYHLSIITNGLKEVQRARLSKLNIDQYFDSIIVSDEIGVAKPNPQYFEVAYQSIPQPPPKEQVLVIGDNIKSDILGGQQYGFHTCWVNALKKPNQGIVPDFEVRSVIELIGILG